jgi:hypothetical protein
MYPFDGAKHFSSFHEYFSASFEAYFLIFCPT